MWVDCMCCKRKPLCQMLSDRCHRALIAWVKGVEFPDCDSFSPNYFRGVDGVFDAAHRNALN